MAEKKKMGRPTDNPKSKDIRVRVTNDTYEKILVACDGNGENVAEYVRGAIGRRLNSKEDAFFDWFFSDESKDVFDDLGKADNEMLLTLLDDIVQVLALESNYEWSTNTNKAHKVFNGLKRELATRLK